MRFNKQELTTLASQPSNKFEKEGSLFVTERQEGFFRKTEEVAQNSSPSKTVAVARRSKPLSCIAGLAKVSTERWCRLRGNLLFYFKTNDQFSEPQGVIVLEKCEPIVRGEQLREQDGFAFFIEFSDGLNQRFAAHSEAERAAWVLAIRTASYEKMRCQLQMLREKIDQKKSNRQDVDVDMVRLQIGKEIDVTEVPICESAISCDNLLCDGHGRPPNPSVMVQVRTANQLGWIKYGRTEVIERSSNPQFLCTLSFRTSDGINASSLVRFTAYDVREKLSQTAVPLGSAEISLGVIQETTRLRVPFRSSSGNAGFITIVTWTPDQDRKIPRSPAKVIETQNLGHRRSQSLPPKFGIKLFVPDHGKLSLIFTNPSIHTYRLHSGLGGDISVQEFMLESILCFVIPQQLLSIWILREKELLQEISGMGELGDEWRGKQMDLLDKHLKLLKDYSQAKQNLQNLSAKYFKPSARKADESLEFAPVNLHLQRMCSHNDTLKRSGVLDVITVGAFTRHTGKSKTGGLIKLLQNAKDSPSKIDSGGCKVQAANDAVQAIKQLRKEVVEIMTQLLYLAKSKNPKGMLPLCNEMITKTRALLTIWEPALVEEAFEFIERHRLIDEPENHQSPLSPFKKITQQLHALDLKSPELEDFATPVGPAPDLWPQIKAMRSMRPASCLATTKSPSATDLNAINTVHSSVQAFNRSAERAISMPSQKMNISTNELMSNSLPATCNLTFNETHFDVNGEVSMSERKFDKKPDLSGKLDTVTVDQVNFGPSSVELQNEALVNESRDEILANQYDETGQLFENTAIVLGHNGAFLDTKIMSCSPSANYYRPTEEPEPLDLTQLNIEASVMCLVSKVKFLCGRCGSPAVRLRQPKGSIKRGFNSAPPDVVTSQPVITAADAQQTTITTTTTAQTATHGCPKAATINSKELNLALTQAVGEVARKLKKGNKFTDGLDLSLTTDWASELRPSMRKLRQAMDGLLKTARLMHSVQRLQQDMKKTSHNLGIMYRRDVCFSQALTALITGLMAKLWGQNISEEYVNVLCNLGPLACFEGLLSLYGAESDMWGDMCIAIEDLSAVRFTLVRGYLNRDTKTVPTPRIVGSRQSLTVLLPIPESVFCMIPPKDPVPCFKVTAVFFNIGINEKATLSEALFYTKEQHRSNWDNFDRLKQYHIRFKKLFPLNQIDHIQSGTGTPRRSDFMNAKLSAALLLDTMEEALRANTAKNIRILHLAEDICRALHGIRFTSCKSAKDRTSMAVTLEQCRVLQQEFHLPVNSIQTVLNTMRSEGARSDNTTKNIGLRKYAFNLPQVLSLPAIYRPPSGSYGKAQS